LTKFVRPVRPKLPEGASGREANRLRDEQKRLAKADRQKAKQAKILAKQAKEKRRRRRQKRREEYERQGLDTDTPSLKSSSEETEESEGEEEKEADSELAVSAASAGVGAAEVVSLDDDVEGSEFMVVRSGGAPLGAPSLDPGSSLVALSTTQLAVVPAASGGAAVEARGGVGASPRAPSSVVVPGSSTSGGVVGAATQVVTKPAAPRADQAAVEVAAAPLESAPKRGRDEQAPSGAPDAKRPVVATRRRQSLVVAPKKTLSIAAKARATTGGAGEGAATSGQASGGSSTSAVAPAGQSSSAAVVDLAAKERLGLKQTLFPLVKKFTATADSLSAELQKATDNLLAAVAVSRSGELEAKDALAKLQASVDSGRSEAESAVVAARKERDGAQARAVEAQARAVEAAEANKKLEAALQKAEAAAKASTEAATAHLEQLQQLRGEKDGKNSSYHFELLFWFPFRCLIPSIDAALEKKLKAAEESSRRSSEEREALGVAVASAAQDLGAELRPGATPAEQVGALAAAGRDLGRRGVRFGVRTAFSVLATHYQGVDFPAVSSGFVEGYTDDELAAIRAEAYPPADDLAAKYEEEALPKKK
jgi:hypothetical protein